ncbi:MAG: chemotaxis protein CheX [Pirellulaceae bacterium]
MRAEFINPFVSATHEVFSVMLNCQLTRGPLTMKRTSIPEYEISGLIGLSGKAQGMVVLSLGRETAVQATTVLLGHRPDGITSDVVDAVGELANMIAGSAKAKLEAYEMSVSLPSVICGKNHSVSFPSQTIPIVIPFESDIGPICIDVGLVEVPVPAMA